MVHKKKCYTFLVVVFISVLMFMQMGYARSNTILKVGMEGKTVLSLQKDLKKLGFFSVKPTGYYGQATKSSVAKFQKKYKLNSDGVAGTQTLAIIDRVSGKNTVTSRSGGDRKSPVQLLSWFNRVKELFAIGRNAIVTDVNTGLKFSVKRTYGHNHADVETISKGDTEVLKRIAGGNWSWKRRAAIVEIDGVRMAASFTAMPHAGRDDMPAQAIVSNRSGGYGRGCNLDSVKGNGMNGHFDIHFSGSKTHGTNRVDCEHQNMIRKAYSSVR